MKGWMKRVILFLMVGLSSSAVGVTKKQYCDAVRAQLEMADEDAEILHKDIQLIWGDEQDVLLHNPKFKKITDDLRALSKVYDIKFPALYIALFKVQQEAAVKPESEKVDDNKICDDSITACGICLKERPKIEMVKNSQCSHYACFFHWLRLYCYDEDNAKCPQCRKPLGWSLIDILTAQPWVYERVKKVVSRKRRVARNEMIARDEEVAWRLLYEENPREAARMERDLRSWRERMERQRRDREARMRRENDARFAHYRSYWYARDRH